MNLHTRKINQNHMVEIPAEFNIEPGIAVRPYRFKNGFGYEFVSDDHLHVTDDDILAEVLRENIPREAVLSEFQRRRAAIDQAFKLLLDEIVRGEKR
ncbi:hypothetical protein AYR62_09730 [Secundilactobacillus paracollinoides]|uniref:AbrB family transcriptional regulator n=2 Tax=Secundilactobacillus paracollinoides TaxID=240427 RepID=A0A1B2IYS5_9LACO|nr:hypothetical protein [Secundilactobacillus paracollinoides]ANZ61280.1 hypothetical protein AYR61_07895 [Secundilactobacillus paracollinoides]ANZ64328.1 hypothetical protein AYR62_09730 [Secundilactobacillus paracollinoides]ANZ67202.1 hypothetical protein AYR63_08645 [Secundilactobacillus paracollinoides]KRL76204.1 hypothetical protein FC17_GL002257 [Secundilactobacillus paracollinoides DSM 15502 = JCM 11969]